MVLRCYVIDAVPRCTIWEFTIDYLYLFYREMDIFNPFGDKFLYFISCSVLNFYTTNIGMLKIVNILRSTDVSTCLPRRKG